MKTDRLIALPAVLFCAAIFLFTLIHYVNRSYPIVGHDFRYFVPRLLDSYLHYQINGLSIQWYTPTFGGGIPAYPNPQHLQFTLPGLLVLFMSPWQAIWSAHAVFIVAGFISAYFLFESVCGFDALSSAVGSIIFNVNGFVFSHAVVGHLGYQAFPLLPLMLLGIFHPKMKPLYKGILVALVFSINIHGGGFYVLVIYMLSILMAVPLLIILRPQMIVWKDLWLTLLFAAVFTVSLSGSKIFAVASFLQWFPREIVDHYDVGLLAGFRRIYAQLFGLSSFLFLRNNSGTAGLTEYIRSSLIPRSHENGIWEFETSVSVAALFFCGLVPLAYLFSGRDKKISSQNLLLLVIMLFGLYLNTEFRLTKGFIYPHLRSLPILKSLHVNLRFAASYIFPLSVICVIGFSQLRTWARSRAYATVFFLIVVLVTIAPLKVYASIDPARIYKLAFDLHPSESVYRRIKNGDTFPVNSISDDAASFEVFTENASSLNVYEPIFGYRLEEFHPLLTLGSVSEISDGYYNLTNPASLVYPKENGLFVFERIKSSEQEEFERFINRKQPQWSRPAAQIFLDFLMSFSAIFIPLIVAIDAGMKYKTRIPFISWKSLHTEK